MSYPRMTVIFGHSIPETWKLKVIVVAEGFVEKFGTFLRFFFLKKGKP